MDTVLEIGQWLNENYRIVGFVDALAIAEIIPGPYAEVNYIRYCVRVSRNKYLEKYDEGAQLTQRAVFDTQQEAEQFARETLQVSDLTAAYSSVSTIEAKE